MSHLIVFQLNLQCTESGQNKLCWWIEALCDPVSWISPPFCFPVSSCLPLARLVTRSRLTLYDTGLLCHSREPLSRQGRPLPTWFLCISQWIFFLLYKADSSPCTLYFITCHPFFTSIKLKSCSGFFPMLIKIATTTFPFLLIPLVSNLSLLLSLEFCWIHLSSSGFHFPSHHTLVSVPVFQWNGPFQGWLWH